jgi:sortase A
MNPVSRAKKRRRAGASVLRGLFYILLLSGILALGYAGYVLAGAQAYQALETRRFELPNRRVEAHEPAEGGVIGQIQIPRIGLTAIVVQGDSLKILRRAVGHIRGTALPGQAGNVALAGHRDTFFRPLRHIRPGDVITLKTPGGYFHYQVESTIVVPPSDVEVLRPASRRELTLITCFPFEYVGSAPNRFVVRAYEVKESP